MLNKKIDEAFPVGTGIYRLFIPFSHPVNCVPCGYRDIPKPVDTWIGLTSAFPVGTGIYRPLITCCSHNDSVPCGYRDIPYYCQD